MENNQMVKLERMNHFEGTALSENAFNAVIGAVLLWGVLINAAMSFFFTPYILMIDYRIVLVLYLVLSLGCVMVVYKSNNPAVSFLGFTGLAIAMGLVLTFYLTAYSGSAVYSAFLLTAIVVVTMLLVSTLFPAFFLGIGKTLALALVSSILISLVGRLLLHLRLAALDYGVIVIFAGYIGYDWAKAQAYPHTLDNAIDCAADIYVDIINIFIRILRIMGKRKN